MSEFESRRGHLDGALGARLTASTPRALGLTSDAIIAALAPRKFDASSGLRLGNLLIDYLAFFIFSVAISVVLQTLAALTGNKVPTELGQLIGLVEWVAYYVLFEATLGRTPGKFITRTRVVNRAGGKPTFGQIVGRSFARLVPFEAFSFLGSRGGWHDRWSHTRVVRIPR